MIQSSTNSANPFGKSRGNFLPGQGPSILAGRSSDGVSGWESYSREDSSYGTASPSFHVKRQEAGRTESQTALASKQESSETSSEEDEEEEEWLTIRDLAAFDLYKALQLTPGPEGVITGGPSRIRSAFHKLCMRWHPDIAGYSKEVQTKFCQIVFAFKVLMDPERRSIYFNHSYDVLRQSESYNEESIFDTDPYHVHARFFAGDDPDDREYLLLNGADQISDDESEEAEAEDEEATEAAMAEIRSSTAVQNTRKRFTEDGEEEKQDSIPPMPRMPLTVPGFPTLPGLPPTPLTAPVPPPARTPPQAPRRISESADPWSSLTKRLSDSAGEDPESPIDEAGNGTISCLTGYHARADYEHNEMKGRRVAKMMKIMYAYQAAYCRHRRPLLMLQPALIFKKQFCLRKKHRQSSRRVHLGDRGFCTVA